MRVYGYIYEQQTWAKTQSLLNDNMDCGCISIKYLCSHICMMLIENILLQEDSIKQKKKPAYIWSPYFHAVCSLRCIEFLFICLVSLSIPHLQSLENNMLFGEAFNLPYPHTHTHTNTKADVHYFPLLSFVVCIGNKRTRLVYCAINLVYQAEKPH